VRAQERVVGKECLPDESRKAQAFIRTCVCVTLACVTVLQDVTQLLAPRTAHTVPGNSKNVGLELAPSGPR